MYNKTEDTRHVLVWPKLNREALLDRMTVRIVTLPYKRYEILFLHFPQPSVQHSVSRSSGSTGLSLKWASCLEKIIRRDAGSRLVSLERNVSIQCNFE